MNQPAGVSPRFFRRTGDAEPGANARRLIKSTDRLSRWSADQDQRRPLQTRSAEVKTRQNLANVTEAEMERTLYFGLGNDRWEVASLPRPTALFGTSLVMSSVPPRQARRGRPQNVGKPTPPRRVTWSFRMITLGHLDGQQFPSYGIFGNAGVCLFIASENTVVELPTWVTPLTNSRGFSRRFCQIRSRRDIITAGPWGCVGNWSQSLTFARSGPGDVNLGNSLLACETQACDSRGGGG